MIGTSYECSSLAKAKLANWIVWLYAHFIESFS